MPWSRACWERHPAASERDAVAALGLSRGGSGSVRGRFQSPVRDQATLKSMILGRFPLAVAAPLNPEDSMVCISAMAGSSR
jgi:hypothetical protein